MRAATPAKPHTSRACRTPSHTPSPRRPPPVHHPAPLPNEGKTPPESHRFADPTPRRRRSPSFGSEAVELAAQRERRFDTDAERPTHEINEPHCVAAKSGHPEASAPMPGHVPNAGETRPSHTSARNPARQARDLLHLARGYNGGGWFRQAQPTTGSTRAVGLNPRRAQPARGQPRCIATKCGTPGHPCPCQMQEKPGRVTRSRGTRQARREISCIWHGGQGVQGGARVVSTGSTRADPTRARGRARSRSLRRSRRRLRSRRLRSHRRSSRTRRRRSHRRRSRCRMTSHPKKSRPRHPTIHRPWA